MYIYIYIYILYIYTYIYIHIYIYMKNITLLTMHIRKINWVMWDIFVIARICVEHI